MFKVTTTAASSPGHLANCDPTTTPATWTPGRRVTSLDWFTPGPKKVLGLPRLDQLLPPATEWLGGGLGREVEDWSWPHLLLGSNHETLEILSETLRLAAPCRYFQSALGYFWGQLLQHPWSPALPLAVLGYNTAPTPAGQKSVGVAQRGQLQAATY